MAETGSAWARFQASLRIGFDQWHDGIGYDVPALADMDRAERESAAALMAQRIREGSAGWREIEVADALGDRESLEVAAMYLDEAVSRRALEALRDSHGVEEKVATGVLSSDWSAFSQALDQVPDHRTARVKQALIERVKRRDNGCVPAGMVLLEAFAGVEEAFAERPMLFKIREEPEGGPAFQELVRRVESS